MGRYSKKSKKLKTKKLNQQVYDILSKNLRKDLGDPDMRTKRLEQIKSIFTQSKHMKHIENYLKNVV